MNKKRLNGFGVIDMLLGLLIISIAFIVIMPNLKGVGGSNLNDSSINNTSAKEQADIMINDIEKMRQQAIDAQSKPENY